MQISTRILLVQLVQLLHPKQSESPLSSCANLCQFIPLEWMQQIAHPERSRSSRARVIVADRAAQVQLGSVSAQRGPAQIKRSYPSSAAQAQLSAA